MDRIRRQLSSAHLLASIAIVLACAAPAGAALVTARQLANNSVQSRHIRNGQVKNADLARYSVKGNNLTTGSVGTIQLSTGGVAEVDLADGAVSSSKLAPGAVTATKIADGSIGALSLANEAVTSSKIATNAVTGPTIANGSVNGNDLGQIVGAGVEATNVAVANDALDPLPGEETDGQVVSFGTGLFDTASMWSVAAPSQLVLPSAGVYDVQAWVSWDADNDGYREVQLLQDSTIVAQVRTPSGTGATAGRANQVISATISASTGQSVQLRISHNAGNSLNADRIRMTIRRVGSLT